MYDEPMTVTDKSGAATSQVTRTTTYTFDSAGRQLTRAVVDTSAGVPNIPITTTAYSATTGLPTTVSSSAGTITTGYNALGEIVSYQVPTASGTNTTATTYTIDGEVSAVNDGQGVTSYQYNGTDSLGMVEHRGLATSESTGVTGDTFAGAYDSDGNLISETYPGGLVATMHYDDIGQHMSLSYAMGSSVWANFAASYNDFGESLAQSSPESSQSLHFDQAGRLTLVSDTGDGTCASRTYGYDSDSNRTAFANYPADASNNCSTSTAPTFSETYAHDQTDRISSAPDCAPGPSNGYCYDSMGRTTTVPAGDTYDTTANPSPLSLNYYADDMVRTETQDGVTDTFALDPAERVFSEANSATGAVATNVYSDSSDAPAWISTVAGGTQSWSRNITDLAGNLAAVETALDTAHTTLQLVNLHGDVVATAPDSTGGSGPSSYVESTEFGAPRAATGSSGTTYAWLGGQERSSGGLGGTVLMGARLYLPTTGRFLTTDPVVGGSANSYDYCNQDPVDNIDPAGTTTGPPDKSDSDNTPWKVLSTIYTRPDIWRDATDDILRNNIVHAAEDTISALEFILTLRGEFGGSINFGATQERERIQKVVWYREHNGHLQFRWRIETQAQYRVDVKWSIGCVLFWCAYHGHRWWTTGGFGSQRHSITDVITGRGKGPSL
jgi:RHS repeat-associated protein